MLKLRVRSVTYEAEGILSFELVDTQGAALPAFEAGAHIDIQTPGGLSRRYSLCNVPGQTDHYRIAVLKAPNSRGGSRAMHERVRPGDVLQVSEPHNFFPLDLQVEHTILLAGGIGITPLIAMIEQLECLNKSYELHYCTQTLERTAFMQRLAPRVAAGLVHIHHDHGDPRNGLDIAGLLKTHRPGSQVYFCGPTGFMKAVEAATSHWPESTVHCEYFGAEPLPLAVSHSDGQPLEIQLSKSQRTILVDPVQTLLQALREAQVACESSCESGLCGACKVAYSGGEIEHNDYVLDEQERQTQVLICCARVRQGPVVLEL
jgi:ferredoxin-NADP reductase